MLCFGSSFSPFLWVFGFDSGTRQISTFVVVVLRDPFVLMADHRTVNKLASFYRKHPGKFAVCTRCFERFEIKSGVRKHLYCGDNASAWSRAMRTNLKPSDIHTFSTQEESYAHAKVLTAAAGAKKAKPSRGGAIGRGRVQGIAGEEEEDEGDDEDDNGGEAGEEEGGGAVGDFDDDTGDGGAAPDGEPGSAPGGNTNSPDDHITTTIAYLTPTLTVLVETAPGADLLGSIKTVVSKAVLPSSAHASIATSPAFQGLALTLGIPAEARTMSPWAW